jgi:hypothetical protein
MGIQFGDASTPAYVATKIFHVGVVVGFLAVIAGCIVVDKIANSMYDKGYAKPFFFRGHRIHHFWIYVIAPVCYLVIAALALTGHVQLMLNMIWYRLALLLPVIAGCVAVDFLGDGLRTGSKKVIIGHEWIYVLIPLYIVSCVFNVYV